MSPVVVVAYLLEWGGSTKEDECIKCIILIALTAGHVAVFSTLTVPKLLLETSIFM